MHKKKKEKRNHQHDSFKKGKITKTKSLQSSQKRSQLCLPAWRCFQRKWLLHWTGHAHQTSPSGGAEQRADDEDGGETRRAQAGGARTSRSHTCDTEKKEPEHPVSPLRSQPSVRNLRPRGQRRPQSQTKVTVAS